MNETNSTEPIGTIRVLFPSEAKNVSQSLDNSSTTFREFPAVAVNCSRFPTLVASKSCEFPGMMVEIVKLLADYLNATIEVHTMYDSGNADEKLYIGRIGKTHIDGLMGSLYADEVDTIAYPLQKTIIRHQVFDFSSEIYSVACNIYHRRYDDLIYNKWSFFTVYDSRSWTIIGFTLLLQGLFYVANQYSRCLYTKINFTQISNALWEAVQLHLGQALKLTWRTYSVKFNIVLISLFQAVVIMGVYSSYILSQKLTIVGSSNINGAKELISVVERRERYFATTTASDWFFEALNKSDAYPFKALRKAVKKNPIRITDSEKETLRLASADNALAMVMDDHVSYLMAKEFCNVVPMDEPIAQVSTHLMFKKDSPLIEPINDAISNNRIEIMRIYRKYMEYFKRIENYRCDKLRAPVDIPYFGTCIIYLSLIGAASVVFLIEHAVWHFYHKPRKSVTI